MTTFMVDLYTEMIGPFVLASSPDHRTAAYLKTQVRGQVVNEPDDIRGDAGRMGERPG
ncbi:hypothetical protein [Micromonospora echinospora]|uniref:hypothetical protein n=1 Tax=Micromonospora echinospora TaxID=1877 RepID=UPI0012FD91D1|nr:hypothetical protein [Micromonospora echinospora]